MPNVDIFIRTINQSDQGTKRAVGSLTELSSAIGLVGKGVQIAKKFYDEFVVAADESLRAHAKLDAVLKATGYAAGISATKMDEMAGSLSKLTGIDDDVILDGQAILATFREIGGDVFPRATEAALDMSAVMGQNLQSSMVQLGKALNDPIKGMSALQRVGVTFNTEQKEQVQHFIDINDLAGAQGVILAELEKEFGGSAKAMHEAGSGADTLKNSFSNWTEAVGTGAIPLTRSWTSSLSDMFDAMTKNKIAANDDATVRRRAIEMLEKETGQRLVTSYQINANAGAIEKLIPAAREEIEVEKQHEDQLATLAGRIKDELVPTLEEEEAAIKELTEANKSYLSEIGNISDRQKDYAEQQKEINADLNLSDEERKAKLDELAVKQEDASHRMILSMLEVQLTEGGLSASETAFLIEQGVEWGIYSQTAIDEMAAAQAKVLELQAQYDAIPSLVTTDIVTNHITTYSGGGGTGVTPYASGGSFIVPNQYGNEGFNMGGMATASAGETVSITPRSQSNNNNGGGIDYNRLARALTSALMAAGE